jgi:hypothetical protein
MLKTSRARQKLQTHFDQVPLEVVKKLLVRQQATTAKAATLAAEKSPPKNQPSRLASRATAIPDTKRDRPR